MNASSLAAAAAVVWVGLCVRCCMHGVGGAAAAAAAAAAAVDGGKQKHSSSDVVQSSPRC